jgi:hypothetical protein
MLPGIKRVFDVDLLSVNIKTKKGEKSCDEDEELAAPEGVQEEGWLCGGIAGCADGCADD